MSEQLTSTLSQWKCASMDIGTSGGQHWGAFIIDSGPGIRVLSKNTQYFFFLPFSSSFFLLSHIFFL